MTTLFLHFLRARLRGWRLVGTLALALAMPAASSIAILVRPAVPPDVAQRRVAEVAVVSAVFLALAMVAVAAPTLRDERDDETLGWVVLTPRPRWHVAAAAIGAGIAVSMVLALATSATLTVVGVLAGAGPGIGASTLAATCTFALGYGAAAATVGYVAPRGVAVLLFYVFVWETIVLSLLSNLATTSLLRIGLSAWGSVVDLPEAGRELLGPIQVGAGGALVKSAGVVLVLGVLLWQMLQRRDLV